MKKVFMLIAMLVALAGTINAGEIKTDNVNYFTHHKLPSLNGEGDDIRLFGNWDSPSAVLFLYYNNVINEENIDRVIENLKSNVCHDETLRKTVESGESINYLYINTDSKDIYYMKIANCIGY